MRFVSYFDYVRYPPAVPKLRGRDDADRHPVTIVGGGPIGFAMALGLARHGIRSVVIEADDSVCLGSRAGCITRRSLEIFEQLGVAAPMMRQGLPWSEGWSYHRTTPVLHLTLPDDGLGRYPLMLNIQQCYVEQFMVDAIAELGGLIDIRWQSRVTSLEAKDDHVTLDVETPLGSYRLDSDWVVACDGAHSTVRKALGLRFVGTRYEHRYVIVDIKMKSDLPPGRRAWFDPPSNPGCSLLLHKHRNDLWRFDYQLRDDEDADEAVKPANVLQRVRSHLELIGETAPWDPVWISIYKASSLTLESYRHGRIFFAGDAAHLVPIFGVRGMNSGIDDTHNLAWKLALVLKGAAGEALLDSYSDERVFATRENIRHASKSAEFMAPPSPAFQLMRSAVLSLAERHDWIRSLINPRQSTAIGFPASPLNPAARGADPALGPPPGDTLADFPVRPLRPTGPEVDHLVGLLGPRFTLLVFAGGEAIGEDFASAMVALQTSRDGEIPFAAFAIVADGAPAGPLPAVVDTGGHAPAKLNMVPGSALLVRPDGHVLGCWRRPDEGRIRETLAACARGGRDGADAATA